jgi:hypothetical protein
MQALAVTGSEWKATTANSGQLNPLACKRSGSLTGQIALIEPATCTFVVARNVFTGCRIDYASPLARHYEQQV